MLNSVGGCSGPLTEVLAHAEKLSNREATSAGPARPPRISRRSVYPPDYSCDSRAGG